MKKKITVVLNQDYSHIGKKGTIHKVSLGYALNYLLPKNLAEIATPKKMKHYQMFENIITQKNEESKIASKKLQILLDKIHKISIRKKSGEKHLFFGNINEKNIISLIELYTGKTLDKKQISIAAIKYIGISQIHIQITPELECVMKVHILPENI